MQFFFFFFLKAAKSINRHRDFVPKNTDTGKTTNSQLLVTYFFTIKKIINALSLYSSCVEGQLMRDLVLSALYGGGKVVGF